MSQCSGQQYSIRSPPAQADEPSVEEAAACDWEVFVDPKTGDDAASGAASEPFLTVTQALTASRVRRLLSPSSANSLHCLTLAGGTHFLGSVRSATASAQPNKAVLQLTAEDSNLMIRGAAGSSEGVVLSGGVRLPPLNWTTHHVTSAGRAVMSAVIPESVQLDASMFNELYIDGLPAVRAKYPNGNPYWHGLYSSPTGYVDSAASWLPARPLQSPPTEIHISTPVRNGTHFQSFDLGVGGSASVFSPPTNFWSVLRPNGGDMYRVPSGLVVNDDLKARVKGWAQQPGGLIHAFHAGYWGSWIFELASVNATGGELLFGSGGFQEARGNDNGGAWYASNLLSELDDDTEWWYDAASRSLYFMPNATSGMPGEFVASQLATLVSIRGSQDRPVRNVALTGLTLTQSSNTFMSVYEAPASGDWSVHRGGALFIEGGANITVRDCLFTQLATNAVAVSNWNLGVSIEDSEFAWLGDSGVIVLGSSALIDGVSNTDQPDLVTVRGCLFHETGAYVKQSAAVFVGLSRRVLLTGNAVFNVPRSAFNINDGFAGNKTISHNALFNAVRETSDHGPINTWDRQPYLTTQAGLGPSLWQHESLIHHNALLNNYNSFYPIDHDDGSCFWTDSYNVQLYGAKKNYLGHSKTDHHELYLYPDTRDSQGPGVCIADQGVERGLSGWGEVWVNNTCVMYSTGSVYDLWYCETSSLYVPLLADNVFMIPPAYNASFNCNVNGSGVALTLQQWQSYGEDLGSVVVDAPPVETLVQMARDMLL